MDPDFTAAKNVEIKAWRQAGRAVLRLFPPCQPLFDFTTNHFPGLLAVARFHEQFVIAGVFVPDMRDDSQPHSLRIKIFCRRRAADAT